MVKRSIEFVADDPANRTTRPSGELVKTIARGAGRDLQKQIKQCVDSAQDDRVIITRHGRPAAVLVGVEGTDWETVVVQSDPKSWKLIRARRRQPTITLAEAKHQLADRPTKDKEDKGPPRVA